MPINTDYGKIDFIKLKAQTSNGQLDSRYEDNPSLSRYAEFHLEYCKENPTIGLLARQHEKTNDSQKSLNLIETNSDKSKYQKEYYKDRIVRTRSDVKGSYFSSVPKSGTGNFSILDNFVPADANLGNNKVGLTGKMIRVKLLN